MSNIGTFIAGRYSATYDAVDVGITRAGYRLLQSVFYENIEETDVYARTLIDMIYQGGNCSMVYMAREYKPGSVLPFWPYGGGFGALMSATLPIARRASDAADAFVLTSTANTPAAATPASLTCTYAILAPGQRETLFNSQTRELPTELQLLPYDVSGVVRWFVLT